MSEDRNKQLFLSLIYSFQMQAMIQLGKLQNPVTGEAEEDLNAAQVTIDMLDMLKEKSRGNISSDEQSFLNQVLGDLKINFVEEKTRQEKAGKENKTGEIDSENENESEKNSKESVSEEKTEPEEKNDQKIETEKAEKTQAKQGNEKEN
ncbi:MAG: DUF1844 domain-containing protein [Bacteroidetes bacterium]|nr:DUF1844 domain-containing protein [Bacteroidota bacterium]